MKNKTITNENNEVYEVEYKYTISGGEPCETGEWIRTTIAANDSREAVRKLHDLLLYKYDDLECFVKLILQTKNFKRIGRIGVI